MGLRSKLTFRFGQIKEAVLVLRAPFVVDQRRIKSKPLSDRIDDATCNPSIIRYQGQWLIASRQVNYKIHAGNFQMQIPIQDLDSVTHLMTCSDNLNVQCHCKLDDKNARRELEIAKNGFEDPRLFEFKDQLYGLWSATNVDVKTDLALEEEPSTDISFNDWSAVTNTMVIARIRNGCIETPITLPSPYGLRREKNWMPFIQNGAIHLMYYLDRLEVYKVENGKLQLVHRSVSPIVELTQWSGSSQFVPWNGEWLGVAHFASRKLRRFGPFYLHRFVLISRDWKLKGLSKPFFFEKKGIEFCAGLAISEQRVIISYGVDDNVSRLVELTRKQVSDMIKKC